MNNSRKREIRIKADNLREKCKVSHYGIIDLFRECERFGYKLLRYPLGEGRNLGFSLKRDDDVIIFTNSSARLSREIFTLAHEIGHVILHFSEKSSFIDDNITINGSGIGEKEQEANYFAACLLMPESEVCKFLDLELADYKSSNLTAMDIARIMSEFSVSFDMALNRLEYIDAINGNEKIRLDNEKIEIRVGNLLRSVGGNARLNLPSNEIDIPFEYIEYVIYNYNHNAIPLETLEKTLSYYKLTVEDVSDRLVFQNNDEDIELDDLIGVVDD